MKTLIFAAIRCSLMFTSTKLLFAKAIPCSLFAVALIVWSPLQMRANTIAFSTSGGSFGVNLDDATFGYAFTLSSPVLVTNLGLFDRDNDGLAASHVVSIWTSTGTQLVQTTIPAGTGATLIDGFRYVSIAPFTLAAGTYTIAGFYTSISDSVLFGTSTSSASGVSYAGAKSKLGFAFPTTDAFSFGFPNSYFGPNFEFTTGVPTPDSGSTVSRLGCALLGLAALRRKLSC
jgi:protein with PEP-CTERM/exosortase system signal